MNTTSTKPQISFDEFLAIESKLEIRIGQIIAAERVPKSYGIKLTVIFGPNQEDEKTAFTNLGKQYEPENLITLKVPFITNLTPTEIKGVKSEVMIMVGKSLDGKDQFEDYSVGTQLI